MNTEIKEINKNNLILNCKKYFEKHKIQAEFLRFLIVGGFATLIDMLAMSLVLYLFKPSAYSNIVDIFLGSYKPETIATIIGTGTGFLCGLVFNYVLSIIFVYDNKGISKSGKGFFIFFILSLFGLLIHIFGMYVGYSILHINEWIIKIILTLVVLVYNYISKKVILFTEVKKEI